MGYKPNLPHLQLDELQPIYPPFTVPPEKNKYPPDSGIFESMIFQTSPGGICMDIWRVIYQLPTGTIQVIQSTNPVPILQLHQGAEPQEISTAWPVGVRNGTHQFPRILARLFFDAP